MCLPRHKQSFFASLSKFVVAKHLWWEFLQGEPCFRLDISAYMLNKIRDLLTYSAIKWV